MNHEVIAAFSLSALKARAFDLEIAHRRCEKSTCDTSCERLVVLASIKAMDNLGCEKPRYSG